MNHQITNRNILIIAGGISLLFSFWSIYIDPVINNDGFLYILVSETIQDGNYSNAFNIYRWPFYSFMLAGLSNVSGLSSEVIAYLLNIILAIIITISFISTVRLLGGDQRVIIFAVIVILLFSGINRYRSFISRDFGYLAFYMLSLFVFFRHLVKPEWYLPVLWSILLVIAALFRIEAIAILISLPFISWFVFADSRKKRIKIGATFGLVLLATFLLLAWWFAGSRLNNANYSGIEGIFDLANRFMAGSIAEYSVRLEQMRTLLTQYSESYAPVILFVTLIIILFSEVIQSITLAYTFILIYSWRKYVIFREDRVRNAWIILIIIQLLILTGALLKYYFITGRFPLALSLTVLLPVPFILSNMYQDWKDSRNNNVVIRWFFPVTVLLIIVASLPSLATFTGKNHYKDGGLWIKQQIKSDEKLLSTDIAITYYAGRNPYKRVDVDAWVNVRPYEREDVYKILKNNQGRNFDYIAISIKKKYKEQEKEIINLVGSPPAKRLKNQFGDELLIFKKDKTRS